MGLKSSKRLKVNSNRMPFYTHLLGLQFFVDLDSRLSAEDVAGFFYTERLMVVDFPAKLVNNSIYPISQNNRKNYFNSN